MMPDRPSVAKPLDIAAIERRARTIRPPIDSDSRPLRQRLVDEAHKILVNPYAHVTPFIAAEDIVKRVMEALASDEGAVEVMAKAHYEADSCEWDGDNYVDKESWRVDMRAALAALARHIADGE